jgi:hypothetical protein
LLWATILSGISGGNKKFHWQPDCCLKREEELPVNPVVSDAISKSGIMVMELPT